MFKKDMLPVLIVDAWESPGAPRSRSTPQAVQAVEGLPGSPKASKVVFDNEKYRFCVGYRDEVRAKLGKK